MRVLFDHGTPTPLITFLEGHTVTKAKDRGWDRLSNGDLLTAAEDAGFHVLVTADKNIRYQQNLDGRRVALVVLGSPKWPAVKLHVEKIVEALNNALPGTYIQVDMQDRK